MHLWARFGLLATNWRLARIPVALDRDSKISTRKGLLLSSPACRYILAVSCQPLFTDGEKMMVFPKVQKHTSCLKTDWGTTTIGLRNQREQETDLIWKATQEAVRGPVTLGLHFLVAQVKSPPAMQETRVRSLGREDPLGEEMATHSSNLAWRIPMDRGYWRATVHEATKEVDMTEQLHNSNSWSTWPVYVLSYSVVSHFTQPRGL